MPATCTSLQSPPRAVLTPRAVRARAISAHIGDAARLYLVDDGSHVGGERIGDLAAGFDGGSPRCVQATGGHGSPRRRLAVISSMVRWSGQAMAGGRSRSRSRSPPRAALKSYSRDLTPKRGDR